MIQAFRPGVVVALAAILAISLWGCGPASPDLGEPAPTHAPQATVIQTVGPEPSGAAIAPPSTPDKQPEESQASVHRPVPPEAEPIASRPQNAELAPQPPDQRSATYLTGLAATSDTTGSSPPRQPAQGQPYTWSDGDRTMTVLLQTHMEVSREGEIALRGNKADQANKVANSARSDGGGEEDSASMPVFMSQWGTLMTLPGGVLLALDKSWDTDEIDAFFERNGIGADRVSGLGNIVNGFFVETSPGFPSLDLANSLAAQDGVRTSMPNWRQDLAAQ